MTFPDRLAGLGTRSAAMEHCVVDLEGLRVACAPVLCCYEAFLATGRLDVASLEPGLAAIRSLPPLRGRLGHALAVVGAGGAGVSTEETVAALETLRRLAPTVRASALRPPGQASSGHKESIVQPCLPGLGCRGK